MSSPFLPVSPANTASSTFPSSPTFGQTSNASSSSASTLTGITRSRTLFYLSIRDSSITPRRGPKRSPEGQYGNRMDATDEEEGLLGARDTKGLPPKWVDTRDEIEETLERIPMKINALEKLHAKHALPGFTDRSAEEREIERQTTDITRDLRRCTKLIGTIRPLKNASNVETTTAKNVQRGLAQRIQDLSGQFRKKQRIYMKKLQGHAIKNKDLLVASGAISLRGSDMIDDLQEDEHASKTQLQSEAQVAMDVDLDQRTNEITQIASSISELADLFRDLGNLVVEQGTVLDSVEYNVQQTVTELKGAEEELVVAQRYQANTGRRKCILLLILIIVGLIIILIYKPRGGPDPVVPPPIEPPSRFANPPADEQSDHVIINRPGKFPLRPPNGDQVINDGRVRSRLFRTY
ncbi:t-SNARE [Kockovaella imperatae]|uniref:t-SNARE n=1 Tax=Kockovaella imperatae TaxID=4999 RepID=A0A1Y1UK81_9TREE|nr:t-SNARE [Kockovaella imperatae]ORX37535.1 t-SNARE [Kockovaella imperatae]